MTACQLIPPVIQLSLMFQKGALSATNHEIPKSKAIRIPIASASPMFVAFLRSFCGSFSAAIEIKMMLSIPNMISRKVSVSSATQASAEERMSNISQLFFWRCHVVLMILLLRSIQRYKNLRQ